jgi:hypothetical protein
MHFEMYSLPLDNESRAFVMRTPENELFLALRNVLSMHVLYINASCWPDDIERYFGYFNKFLRMFVVIIFRSDPWKIQASLDINCSAYVENQL